MNQFVDFSTKKHFFQPCPAGIPHNLSWWIMLSAHLPAQNIPSYLHLKKQQNLFSKPHTQKEFTIPSLRMVREAQILCFLHPPHTINTMGEPFTTIHHKIDIWEMFFFFLFSHRNRTSHQYIVKITFLTS